MKYHVVQIKYTCRPPTGNLFPKPLSKPHSWWPESPSWRVRSVPFSSIPSSLPHCLIFKSTRKQLHVQREQVIQVPKSEVRSVPQSLRDSVKMRVPWPAPRDPDSECLAWGLEVCIFKDFQMMWITWKLFKGHALENTVYVGAGTHLLFSVDLSKTNTVDTHTPVIFIASLPVSLRALGARIILDRGSDTAEDKRAFQMRWWGPSHVSPSGWLTSSLSCLLGSTHHCFVFSRGRRAFLPTHLQSVDLKFGFNICLNLAYLCF